MNIINKDYAWCGNLTKRTKTNYIVLHHAAAFICSPNDVHKIHLQNGWAGIGYHFYIRKDGSIYSGRPINALGSHVSGYNSQCIGVCFEGNFEKENMCEAQIKAGRELVKYLKKIYPSTSIKKHKDLNATACPGKNFPFEKICSFEIEDAKEIVKELGTRGIMTNAELWNIKCVDDINSYWLARKICNNTVNSSKIKDELESVNDIVWELNHRGIITDKELWIEKLTNDTDAYWLARKCANMTINK